MHNHAAHHTHQPTEPPVVLVVDPETDSRCRVEEALDHRFGPDYRIATAATPTEGLSLLERLAREGREVALIIVDLWPGEMDGVDFLRLARALHPEAVRALSLEMGDAPGMCTGPAREPVLRASALGQIDLTILKGWVSPEEWLYPQVQEALSRWNLAHRPRHEHVQVVGPRWSPRCHELRGILTRAAIPYGFYDAASTEGQRLLGAHGLEGEERPVLIFFDGRTIVDPGNTDLAAGLGVNTRPGEGIYDLAIVGAGPAGLAAAVYGASEGLRTVVIEHESPGGQAGTSSMIRNYLGFPRGIGGSELTYRAYEQAYLLGAEFVFAQRAVALEQRGDLRVIRLTDRSEVVSRAVVLATGVAYRRLGIDALDRLIGAGVFYGAAGAEAQAMRDEEVYIVGAGNSAGQAAVHLARYASRVTLLVRGESLAATMSDYLIRQIEATPAIAVRLQTQVVDGHGRSHLEGVVLEDRTTGAREEVPAAGLFVMIGAEPHTGWLRDIVELDASGYILTGGEIDPARWPLARPVLPLETSRPGVFAVGDVRHGPIKRVAAAVGDGSVAIGYVHQYLAAGVHV